MNNQKKLMHRFSGANNLFVKGFFQYDKEKMGAGQSVIQYIIK